MQLSSYLFFTTTCEQALTFYTACGLGEMKEVRRHGENGLPLRSPTMRGKIMHAKFEGPGICFYASDNDDAEPMGGSGHLIMFNDREKTTELFNKLADGGSVTTPLGIQPWGDYYGKLRDKFGVQWMLNCTLPNGP